MNRTYQVFDLVQHAILVPVMRPPVIGHRDSIQRCSTQAHPQSESAEAQARTKWRRRGTPCILVLIGLDASDIVGLACAQLLDQLLRLCVDLVPECGGCLAAVVLWGKNYQSQLADTVPYPKKRNSNVYSILQSVRLFTYRDVVWKEIDDERNVGALHHRNEILKQDILVLLHETCACQQHDESGHS